MSDPSLFVRVRTALRGALFSGAPEAPRPGRALFGVPVQQAADLLLAFLLMLMAANNTAPHSQEARPIGTGLVVLAIAATGPLALRRLWPLVAWRAALAGWLLLVLSEPDHRPEAAWGPGLAMMLILYTVAVRCEPETVLGVWLVTVVATPVLAGGLVVILLVVAFGVTSLFGYNVRARRSVQSLLAVEEARSAEEKAKRSVLEERTRIARELHDVVAHHMSVIAIQAEAAPYLAPDLPEPITGAFAEIRSTALDALAETRRMLGVLRQEEDGGETAPQPDLARLDDLVASARSAGLSVEVSVLGLARPLPPGLGLNAYRIIQEALSNAMRHAPGAAVLVSLDYRPDLLELAVLNGRPPGDRVPFPPGGGHGMVGMRERASMLGGELSAGPTDEGGFAVRARLPLGRAA
ncbi:sensor histidine kinase [Actinocorallia longicatena]|uniref:histidine kinase n=1 Tax=Actinocorallia longicatena TaxID=111803 RepID=A0ABP6QIE8_9ACTN